MYIQVTTDRGWFMSRVDAVRSRIASVKKKLLAYHGWSTILTSSGLVFVIYFLGSLMTEAQAGLSENGRLYWNQSPTAWEMVTPAAVAALLTFIIASRLACRWNRIPFALTASGLSALGAVVIMSPGADFLEPFLVLVLPALLMLAEPKQEGVLKPIALALYRRTLRPAGCFALYWLATGVHRLYVMIPLECRKAFERGIGTMQRWHASASAWVRERLDAIDRINQEQALLQSS